MAPTTRRQRKETSGPQIKYAHPDRSAPDPSRETLLDIAAKRGLINLQENGEQDDNEEEKVGRAAEALLWTMSLAMLHFTLDVLVQHQYAMEIEWNKIVLRFFQAFLIFYLLFYTFHRHPDPSMTLPDILPQWQPFLHQLLFFSASVATGCYLIHITNVHTYIAVMKRAPALGCLWIWSVIELDLIAALPSLAICVGFLKIGGYSLT